MTINAEIKQTRVLCIYCKKPIHINRLAGICKEGMFCNNIICLMSFGNSHKR